MIKSQKAKQNKGFFVVIFRSSGCDIFSQRLAIAREFGDKAAERRAYSNLGNAHIFLGEFDVAADHYK